MARVDERGTGVIGTVMGTGAFLLLLLFAVQVLVGLYTRSVVGAAAYDAAKAVAGSDGGPASRVDAERNARAQLGGYGAQVRFSWAGSDQDVVRLTATGPRRSFLPAALTGPAGLGDVERRVTVRREVFR